jgi:agmatine/peptidylarginine deiminase
LKIIYCIFIINVSIAVYAQDAPLPHYLTDQEKALYKNYLPPQNEGTREQPPSSVRTMAEWEELQGVQITWTSYQEILRQIVDYAQDEVLVYIVCSDSNSVKNYLKRYSIPIVNLRFLIEPFNSIWCRDYGPWTAYAEGSDQLNIIDWIYNRPRPSDDVIPAAFAEYIGAPYFATTDSPDDLTHTGGNFMTDGQGNAFSSKLILDENSGKTEAQIDDIMNRYMGITRYVKMTTLPYDEIHHIDMHMKLLDEETLLVGQYPEGVADGPQIEANLQYILDNFQTCYGRPYNVARIPMPPDQSGRYPDAGGDYRTYTNSLICNKTVIMPTYEEKYDTTALRIYRDAMPGYRVVGIDCNDIITSLGAIHCITKETGAENPLFIAHAAIRQAHDLDDNYPVIALITSNSGIASASLLWTTDTTAGFNELAMTATVNDSFYAAIPAQTSGTVVYYYLSATSGIGKTVAKPLVAPDGWYRFRVESASALTVRRPNLPQVVRLEQNYPNPFNSETEICFSLPSESLVGLFVFNMIGQRIEVLKEGRLPAGMHRARFNAGLLPSGVYIYALRVNGISQYRKMMLIR